jgi:hypothetical protein
MEKYLEEIAASLLLHKNQGCEKLSWTDTYKAMSDEQEDWIDFDAVAGDGVGAKNFSPLQGRYKPTCDGGGQT